MNLKLKAALYTAGFFAATVATSVLVSYVAGLMTVAQVTYLLGVFCISGLVYTIYGVMLARMEYYEHLKQMAEKSVDIK
jgi:membrane-bound ClpP family serine protease